MAKIKQIKLPGVDQAYDIYDASAIHSLADLEGLGLEGAFVFKGTVATVANLPSAGNEVGYVYHVTENDSEYVWTTSGEWEEFGRHIVVDHIHDFSGTATVTGTNQSSTVSGTATGNVTVPKINKLPNYLKVTGSVSNVAVGGNGTAAAITGFGTHTTADAITDLNTASVNSASASEVTIPNVTANTAVTASKVDVTAGSKASWTATVDANGVLSFAWTANTPTAVSSTDVAASKVTLGTALKASKVTTSAVTVATGAKSTAKAITALGTPTTANALTGVKVTTQPTLTVNLAEGTSTDGVLAGDTVAVSSEEKSVSLNVSGTAAAQTWTQKSGTVSGTTGSPK